VAVEGLAELVVPVAGITGVAVVGWLAPVVEVSVEVEVVEAVPSTFCIDAEDGSRAVFSELPQAVTRATNVRAMGSVRMVSWFS